MKMRRLEETRRTPWAFSFRTPRLILLGTLVYAFLHHGKIMPVFSYYVQIMQLLQPLFTNPSHISTSGNATGALARMSLRSPDAVPLDRVLPVILQQLPLKEDFEENEP